MRCKILDLISVIGPIIGGAFLHSESRKIKHCSDFMDLKLLYSCHPLFGYLHDSTGSPTDETKIRPTQENLFDILGTGLKMRKMRIALDMSKNTNYHPLLVAPAA